MLVICIILLIIGCVVALLCLTQARHDIRYEKVNRIWIRAILATVLLSVSIAGINSSVKRIQLKAIDKYINGEYEIVEYSVNGVITKKELKLK